jgi:hypothetical protein
MEYNVVWSCTEVHRRFRINCCLHIQGRQVRKQFDFLLDREYGGSTFLCNVGEIPLSLPMYKCTHNCVHVWIILCPFVTAGSETSIALIPKSAHGHEPEAVTTTLQPLNRECALSSHYRSSECFYISAGIPIKIVNAFLTPPTKLHD